jgi:hypothetical protein
VAAPALVYAMTEGQRLEPVTSGSPQFHGVYITSDRRPNVQTVQAAPDPIRQGDEWAVGKPPGHQWGRQEPASQFNLASTLAIEGEEFAVLLLPPRNWIQPINGQQLPWLERPNIRRVGSVPYGSLLELDGIGV